MCCCKIHIGTHVNWSSRKAHIRITKLGRYWFRWWLVVCSAPNHYQNQCGIVVNWTLANIFQWYLNQNTTIFIEENAFANVVWKCRWRKKTDHAADGNLLPFFIKIVLNTPSAGPGHGALLSTGTKLDNGLMLTFQNVIPLIKMFYLWLKNSLKFTPKCQIQYWFRLWLDVLTENTKPRDFTLSFSSQVPAFYTRMFSWIFQRCLNKSTVGTCNTPGPAQISIQERHWTPYLGILCRNGRLTLKIKVDDPHFQYHLRESQDAQMVQISWF